MTLRNEIEVYDRAKVSNQTGEMEAWDDIIFPGVIRKREIEIILKVINDAKPKLILDFGCGGGWLSCILASHGYRVVGVDASSSLISNAISSVKSGQFVIGDCMALPFKNGCFDFVIGIAILHHLDIAKSLAECHRVACDGATLMFIEPNSKNPFATLGRKMVKLDICTEGEKPISPHVLKEALSCNNHPVKLNYLFPFSFGLAFLLGKIRWRGKRIVILLKPFIIIIETLWEKIPLINQLCWTIVATKRIK